MMITYYGLIQLLRFIKKTTEWLRSHEIPIVEEDSNPPNLPQARPIENFWGILSSKMYEDGWRAQHIDQLIAPIKN